MTNRFSALPIEVHVCVGRARPSLGELLELAPNAVLTLEQQIDDPVEIMIGERVIAHGTLEEVEDGTRRSLCVRLTSVRSFENDA